MNIFCLNEIPVLAAKDHCSKHCIKQLLESVQLLCTAHRVLDGNQITAISKSGRNVKRWVLKDSVLENYLYSASHVNHPSAVWCRETYLHYCWLANLLKSLCIEYTYRYGKVHKCEQIGLVDWLVQNHPKNIDMSMKFRLPDVAMPDDVKVPGDVVTSYRKYYVNHKQRMLSWDGKVNNREVPYWINDKSLLLTA